MQYTLPVRVFALAYAIPFLLEVLSLLLFVTKKPWLDLDASFYRQGLVLFGIILAAQTLLYILKRGKERFPFLLILMSSAAVLGYALGRDIQCETLIYAAAVFTSVLAFPSRTGLLFGSGYCAVTPFLQHDVVAWERYLPGPDPGSILFMFCLDLAFLAAAYVIGEARKRARNDILHMKNLAAAVSNLTNANIGFQQYADSIVEHSLGEERRRISRELHDTIGYSLTNIRMMMEEAIGLYDGSSEDFVQLLVYARDQAKNALEDTRSSLKVLRSMYAEHLPLDLRAVQRLSKAFSEATHVKVLVDFTNTRGSYGKDVDHFVYRFVQEGMTNSFRHGKAAQIRIYLFEDDRKLHISLADNGKGCKEVVEGVGIAGMRERVRKLGGALSLGSTPYGFSIHAMVSLPGEAP